MQIRIIYNNLKNMELLPEANYSLTLRHECLIHKEIVINQSQNFIIPFRIKEAWQVQVFVNSVEYFLNDKFSVLNIEGGAILGDDSFLLDMYEPLYPNDELIVLRPSYIKGYNVDDILTVGTIEQVNNGYADLVEEIAINLVDNKFAEFI